MTDEEKDKASQGETSQPEEPKIIVDEDWKSQAQAEKEAAEAAKRAQQKEKAGGTAAGDADQQGTQQEAQPAADKEPASQPPPGDSQKTTGTELPAPSFSMLVSSFAAQAMAAMGKIPDPVEGHAVVRPDVAKHFIDILGMLEEKTKGNLTGEEEKMMDGILHELRMTFVLIRNERK